MNALSQSKPYKPAARVAPNLVQVAIACLLLLTPVMVAQETPPAPAPETQPEQPKPAPEPTQPDSTKPDPQPVKPDAAPANPAPAKSDQPKVATPQPAVATPVPETPGDVPEGRQLFMAAADIIKKSQAITFRCKTYGIGPMLAMYTAKTQADVRLLRTPSGWLCRATGSGGSFSIKDGSEFDMAWLGAHNEWVDHDNKKVFEKNAADTKGPAVQLAPSTKVEEFTETSPFSAAIAAPDYVIEAQKEQGGVKCDVILTINGRIKVRWMLGAEDHLPRWKERIIEGNSAAGSMITEISNIAVDTANPPRMTPEMLRVTVPEGYTEERVPPPPPPAAPVEKTPAAPVPTTTPAVNPAEATPTGPVGPPAPVAPVARNAPDFQLKDSKGATVSLASLKGNAVVLEFAGTWCLPLREAHPELEALTKDYAHHPVKVYMLDVREKSSDNAIDDFTKGAFTFGLLLNADAVARLYEIKTYPSYAVIDKDGMLKQVVGNYAKYDTMNTVREALEAITGGPSVPKPENPNPAPKPEDAAATPAPAPAPLPAPAPAKSPVAPTKTPSMPPSKNPSMPPKK